MQLSTRDEQLNALAKVLSAGEEEAGVEVADVGDDVTRTKRAKAQRTTGSLAALSGAHGLTYMEVCRSSWIATGWKTLQESSCSSGRCLSLLFIYLYIVRENLLSSESVFPGHCTVLYIAQLCEVMRCTCRPYHMYLALSRLNGCVGHKCHVAAWPLEDTITVDG